MRNRGASIADSPDSSALLPQSPDCSESPKPNPVATRFPFVLDVETARTFLRSFKGNSLRARFVGGVLWSTLGAVASQGLTLATSVVVARFLGKTGFGEFGMIQSTVAMLAIFAGMGLGMTANKHVAELKWPDPSRAGRMIGLSNVSALVSGFLLAMALFVFSRGLAATVLNAPTLVLELRIAAGLLMLIAINGAQTGTLCGFEAFKAIARTNIIRGVSAFPVAIAAVWRWGLPGAVCGLAAAEFVSLIFNYVAVRKECAAHGVSIRYRGSWSERRVLWAFSIPAVVTGALVAPVAWAANAILANQPNGYSELGVFNAANQWRSAIIFGASLLSQPLLPMLSNLAAEGRAAAFKRILTGNLIVTLAASSGIALVVILLSPWILRAYGRNFTSGVWVMVLLVSAAVLSSTVNVIGYAIASLGKMWSSLAFNAVWAPVLFSSAWLLVPRYGAMGLAEAVFISYVVHVVLVGGYTWLVLRPGSFAVGRHAASDSL